MAQRRLYYTAGWLCPDSHVNGSGNIGKRGKYVDERNAKKRDAQKGKAQERGFSFKKRGEGCVKARGSQMGKAQAGRRADAGKRDAG